MCGRAALDQVLRLAGEAGEVLRGKAAVGGSEKPDDVSLQMVAVKLVKQFLPGSACQASGEFGRLQFVADAEAERVVFGDIIGKLQVSAAGDYHPHALRRPSGQQGSDAGKPAARPGALVVIEPVHDKHKALSAFSSPLAD